MGMVISIIIVLLSIVGLIISTYIYRKKVKKEKLVCLIGKNCDKVVKSKYGKAFAIDNDALGIIYFALLLISSTAFIIYPSLLTDAIIYLRMVFVGLTVLFSIYLTVIQIFVLKELCEYCMGVNLTNAVIFILFFF